MPKVKCSYKARRARNGGADRYGTFRDGVQRSSDIIAGHLLWSVKPSSSNLKV
jgi:hypothetical protein